MFKVREAKEADEACVFATWLNSYKHGAHFPRKVPDAVYFAQHHGVIERLLKRSRTVVATIPEDEDVILGWACYEPAMQMDGIAVPAIVHYVYVKPDFRRAGVAARLLSEVDANEAMYTHHTFVVAGPLANKVRKWIFNPYAALSAS